MSLLPVHLAWSVLIMRESIVLVAGLGGHYLGTWEASDRTVWPKDLLPQYISNIRVLSFQYNTTLRGTTSKAKIHDHALELLNQLDLDRLEGSDESAAVRPIIFVGHSLGGMLIKKASIIPTYLGSLSHLCN
jgi:hypothetical protein